MHFSDHHLPSSVGSVSGAELLPAPILVDSPAAFESMLAALRREPAMALDTESDSLYRYFYKVCLIQISIPSADYLLDPLRLSDLAPLGRLLADSGMQKVFHAAENDILMLKRDLGFRFSNVFDTMIAARILGWSQVSLAALLSQHFGVTLDKRAQLTDWGQRPLTREQLRYARLDSHYLLALRDILASALHQRGRWREALEAFAEVAEVAHAERQFDPDGFWRIKGARDLNPGELAVLRELYLWRDRQARAMDRPPFKVLGEDALLNLSRRQPRHLEDLPLGRWHSREFGQAILAAIARGQGAPPPQPPRSQNGNGRLDPAVLARFDRLRNWRTQRAAERSVSADLVLTNAALMVIARAAPSSPEELAALGVMGPWKLEEYGSELLGVLGGR